MSTPPKKLKSELTSQERVATANSRAQTTPVPTPLAERGRSDGSKTETPAPRSGDRSLAASPAHRIEDDGYAGLMEVLGTTDLDFAKGIYAQLTSASSRGDGMLDAVGLFFSLAAVKGKKPTDQFQAMLIAQAAVTQSMLPNWHRPIA
jgi:hypothetical protein